MEVTFDNSVIDLDWADIFTNDKFKRVNAEEYLPLHQYILDRKSPFVCHLNSDGVTAGAPEAPDTPCNDRDPSSLEPDRWRGKGKFYVEREEGENGLGGKLSMRKGPASISGEVKANKKNGVSGRVDFELDF